MQKFLKWKTYYYLQFTETLSDSLGQEVKNVISPNETRRGFMWAEHNESD